ncbi:hypothetical protein [Alkalihalobacterium alkalinitrilicum]|uniref:hypothetical protein n=1 Tax=Alkalihalobacterium alkalinitrilicum TaxID=427920 RepID=UPI000994D675|nr:hypothetical protein [Alkalihalobacterium alkalinitrilicum]
MSYEYYYDLCSRNIGADVEIRDHHGKLYVGQIERVDRECVYLRPIGPSHGPGHGMYFFAAAALTAIAIASIAAFRFRRRRFHHGPFFY